jgi:hypothetical protein
VSPTSRLPSNEPEKTWPIGFHSVQSDRQTNSLPVAFPDASQACIAAAGKESEGSPPGRAIHQTASGAVAIGSGSGDDSASTVDAMGSVTEAAMGSDTKELVTD